jgi:hypothetical protein
MDIDLKAEQEATLARPHMTCGAITRMLFAGMDLLYGRETRLTKVRLLEILARIPYQAWETSRYGLLSRTYADDAEVNRATEIIEWGRHAQDNEFWHLRVIERRMARDGIREGWVRRRAVARIACFKYALFSRMLARFRLRRAFLMNAEFEDHAEHVYMQFVKDHPEWEREAVNDPVVDAVGGPYANWADVFRRIALDERDHMNDSLRHCGLADRVVPYLGENG